MEVRCERSVTEKFSGKDEEGDDTEDAAEEEGGGVWGRST